MDTALLKLGGSPKLPECGGFHSQRAWNPEHDKPEDGQHHRRQPARLDRTRGFAVAWRTLLLASLVRVVRVPMRKDPALRHQNTRDYHRFPPLRHCAYRA